MYIYIYRENGAFLPNPSKPKSATNLTLESTKRLLLAGSPAISGNAFESV